jgi:hypothetical protein
MKRRMQSAQRNIKTIVLDHLWAIHLPSVVDVKPLLNLSAVLATQSRMWPAFPRIGYVGARVYFAQLQGIGSTSSKNSILSNVVQ